MTKALDLITGACVPRRLMVDASHGNSGKDHRRQSLAAAAIVDQVAAGEHGVTGVMLESFLPAGRQEPGPPATVTYGQSVTDACMDIGATAAVLDGLAAAVRSRRTLGETPRSTSQGKRGISPGSWVANPGFVAPARPSRRGEVGDGGVDALLGEFEVGHLAGQVLLVGHHVEVAVAAQRGQDHLRLARLGALLGFLDGGGQRVRGLGRRDDALGPGEQHRGGEALPLRLGHRLEHARARTCATAAATCRGTAARRRAPGPG